MTLCNHFNPRYLGWLKSLSTCHEWCDEVPSHMHRPWCLMDISTLDCGSDLTRLFCIIFTESSILPHLLTSTANPASIGFSGLLSMSTVMATQEEDTVLSCPHWPGYLFAHLWVKQWPLQSSPQIPHCDDKEKKLDKEYGKRRRHVGRRREGEEVPFP